MKTIREIVDQMNSRAEQIAKHLLPEGRLVKDSWVVGSINGEPGQSLKIHISGGKQGVWADFATGQAGDLLDLWRTVKGHNTNKEALVEIKQYLGIAEPEFTRPASKTYRRPPPPKEAKRPREGSAVTRYLTEERKLTTEAIARYQIGEADSIGPWEGWKKQQPAKGPWIVLPSSRSGELVGVKYLHVNRRDGKKITMVEPGCEPTCFGWHAIDPSSRELVICEGEIDAASLYIYGHPAVSVPFGGGKGGKQQWVDHDWPWLEPFDTIYLCLDGDKEGQAATDELVQRLGICRCKVVALPHKDANECLQKGVPKEEIDKCFASARFIEPEELKNAAYFTEDVVSEFYPTGGRLPGFDTPWKKIPFRFLRGEVSTITGTNGHGKSLMCGHIALAGCAQDERWCIASLEMQPKKTLYRMVRQATGVKNPSRDEITACLGWMSDKVWLFNLVGTGKVDRMMEVFDYAFRRYGIKQFLIDSLMKCGIAEDDYKAQKDFIERLCDFAAKTGAHVHLIAHPRKGEDELKPVGKLDIKGTGAISDLAFNNFVVWRNKQKEEILRSVRAGEPVELPKGVTIADVERKPDAMLIIDKARNIEDVEGRYALFYEPNSMQYLEREHLTAIPYFKTPEREVEDEAPY